MTHHSEISVSTIPLKCPNLKNRAVSTLICSLMVIVCVCIHILLKLFNFPRKITPDILNAIEGVAYFIHLFVNNYPINSTNMK